MFQDFTFRAQKTKATCPNFFVFIFDYYFSRNISYWCVVHILKHNSFLLLMAARRRVFQLLVMTRATSLLANDMHELKCTGRTFKPVRRFFCVYDSMIFISFPRDASECSLGRSRWKQHNRSSFQFKGDRDCIFSYTNPIV